jgi:MSHA type pilus biogenesis protein MshL
MRLQLSLLLLLFITAVALCACGGRHGVPSGDGHLTREEAAPQRPTPPEEVPAAPQPAPPRFSVNVRAVPVGELLTALAHGADLDIDIAPEIDGRINLQAHQQTLAELIARIARQVPLRHEIRDGTLIVEADAPYLDFYAVDYVNLARETGSKLTANTQISTPAASGEKGNANISSSQLESKSRHDFWAALERSIRQILGSNEASAVVGNPEGGLIAVLATTAQHRRVADLIRRTSRAATRQVMIEATIVEVELSENYQQGIDWSRVKSDGSNSFSVTRASIGGDPASGLIPFALRADRLGATFGLKIALDLLHSFGEVRVLSSPHLSVLNNQTALLKVVENVVYFTVKADTTVTASVGTTTTVTTTPQSVSVGLVLSVTPQIDAEGTVIMNVRPTISSIAKFVSDPNPSIPIPNQVPQIRTREIESVMRIHSGDIAVLGGLMEDRVDYRRGGIPGLADVPLAGELFTARNNGSRKSELVIFLRPTAIRVASIEGDYAPLRQRLPTTDFFDQAPANGNKKEAR